MRFPHKPHRNPKGLTKADKEAQKSDDLLKRDFTAEKPLEKAVTDITEIAGNNGKLYVSAYFDCFNLEVLGLAMDTNMKAPLCVKTLENACKNWNNRRICSSIGGMPPAVKRRRYYENLKIAA